MCSSKNQSSLRSRNILYCQQSPFREKRAMSMPASITNVALFFKPTLYIKSEVENPYSAPALNRGLSHLLTATLFVVCCLCSFTHFHPYPCPKYWWISLTYKTSTKHSTVWLIGMERHSNILSACFTVAKFLDPNYH